MKKLIGYTALSFFTALLFISTLNNLWHNHKIFFFVLSFFLIGVVVSLIQVFKELKPFPQGTLFLRPTTLHQFTAVFAGSVITYIISIYGGLGAVVGSALVGIFAALFFRPLAVPIFCGSFVGMASPELLTIGPFLLASGVAGVLFVLAIDSFNGFGGKLGTIALSSALIIWFFFRPDFLQGTIFTPLQSLVIVGLSALAALLTYVMSINLKQGPVLASAFIGLVAGGFLPFFSDTIGTTLAIVAFGASFVGMSNTERMPTHLGVMVGGVLFGLIFVYSAPYFGGAGGKLGTIAFASTLSLAGFRTIVLTLFPNRKCMI